MNYPRIYSFSTVGIRNHYIQDYLFHPLRTDFVGGNGTGKSIIADLLQLLFVYDSKLIRFGTDGIDRDKRKVHTLPYKTNTAYCFINVEVQKGRFILLGVCISAKANTRPTPFLVVNDANWNKPLDQVGLTTDQLLLSKNFLIKNEIPALEDIARHLLSASNLYLTAFKNNDDIKEYYHFLFNKHLLPINLSQEESLRSFARVIQSFSKAKSLHLNTSDSIKDFLFDDTDKQPAIEYEEQKLPLEKLLVEFNRLSQYVDVLEDKQKKLVRLQLLDEERQMAEKIVKKATLTELSIERKLFVATEHEFTVLWRQEKDKESSFTEKLDKLPGVKLLADQHLTELDEASSDLTQIEQKLKTSEKLEIQITELRMLPSISLSEDTRSTLPVIDISIRTPEEIATLVKKANGFIRKYKEFSRIEKQYQDQQREIQLRRSKAEQELQSAKDLLQILNSSADNSLLSFVLQKKQKLNLLQETTLIRFLNTSFQKPHKPKEGDQYLLSDDILAEINLEEDTTNSGLWITLGSLREFIPVKKSTRLFDKINDLDLTKEKLKTLAATRQQNSIQVLAELGNISKGETYAKNIIDYDFDLSLISYMAVEDIKEGLACSLLVAKKITTLTQKLLMVKKEITDIMATLPLQNDQHDINNIKQQIKDARQVRRTRSNNLSKLEGKLEAGLTGIRRNIGDYRKKIDDAIEKAKTTQEQFDTLHSAYFRQFQENLSESDLVPLTKDIASIKRETEEKIKSYKQLYNEIVATYDETKEQKSQEVNLQINDDIYAFKPLMHALLGTKIKHTDDIGNTLRDANGERRRIAENIKEGMMKIFEKTLYTYREYDETVKRINNFFIGRKISGSFYFRVNFTEHPILKIKFLEELTSSLTYAHKRGELAFSESVNDFIEGFFKKIADIKFKVPVHDLLNPKTFFSLSVQLTDELNQEIAGSTGQTYSAIALLGIARLSLVQVEKRNGLRFIILEEIGSLDATNFNTFPAIANEYKYQMITMAPKPFGANISDEWYVHHLIPGKQDVNINYSSSASYFKTKDRTIDLNTYQKSMDR